MNRAGDEGVGAGEKLQTERTSIPLPIKREVRQRCGFGCVICGMPLYEYEHMLGWANVRRHVAAEITLLCDRHHKEKTNGLLPIARIQEADASPFNLASSVSKPYDLHFSGGRCVVEMGESSFSSELTDVESVLQPLVVDDEVLVGFTFAQGHLFLTLQLFGAQGELLLFIDESQLIYSTDNWDIELVGRALTVRSEARKIRLELVFDPPDRIHVRRGHFFCNGIEVAIHPFYVLLVNNRTMFSGSRSEGVPIGFLLGDFEASRRAMFRMGGIRRISYDEGTTKDATRWANEKMRKKLQDER